METLDLPTIGCNATNMYATVLEWWAYPCNYSTTGARQPCNATVLSRERIHVSLTFGCLATTGVSNLRLPNNDGIRPNTSQYKEVKLSLNKPWRNIGLWDGDDPALSRQPAHRLWWGRQPYHWPRFKKETFSGTHFCWRLSNIQGNNAPGRIKLLVIFSVTSPGNEIATFCS
jgi:hypothetical protein